jgi:starch-binding outer membrane protein, SusD/RagB family
LLIKKEKTMNSLIKIFTRYSTLSLLLVCILCACKKDFFDLKDQNGIDSRIWDNEGPVNLFLNRTYDLVMPTWPIPGSIHNTSDELNNASKEFLYGTLTENSVQDIGTGNDITKNRYFDIRRCNVAIDGMNEGSLPEDVKNKLKGQFFFLRAFVYFRLVSLYGGVPLILHPQDLSGDDLNVPRAKTSECIAAIVNDLDSAAAYLPASWGASDIGRITKAAAYAFKGKVLLYWASPQFNPTNITSRWETAYAACKQAYDTCVANGYALFGSYANIFITEDNKEVILVRKHDAVSINPGRGTNSEYITRPFSESAGGGGSNQPTLNLVLAYTMSNGLPLSHDSSKYDTAQFWKNRDPRFDMTIAYNGASWPLSGKSLRKQWQYKGVVDEPANTINTGFYCKRICNPSLGASQALYNSNSGGGNGMDWIEMRFAEVIMNLAECANETGKLTEAKDMVRLIRKRAGIVQGDYDYGLKVATDMQEMRRLILNERQVEFAIEGKRYWDLRRTRNYGLIFSRFEMRWVPKPPYYAGVTRTGALPGDIFLDKADVNGVKPRDTANLNNIAVYNAMFNREYGTIEGNNVISIPEKYYFYALPTFFSQATYTMAQTKGWAGGTFDPLQ